MLLRLIEDGKPENFQLQIYDLPVIIANRIALSVLNNKQAKNTVILLGHCKSMNCACCIFAQFRAPGGASFSGAVHETDWLSIS